VSVAEAKERLRAVASEHEFSGWVRRHPAEGVLGSLFLGILVGSTPRAQDALKDLAVVLLKLR
jgi:hypothetical protein